MKREAPRRRARAGARNPGRNLVRKDRLIQTRVPRTLESTLKREAQRRRLTVSHLIRNILEDTFQLVDDVVANVDGIVSDSVELARRVGRDARRVADAVRDAVGEADAPEAQARSLVAATDPLGHVLAWNGVVLNRAAECTRCHVQIARGQAGFVGLFDDPGAARTFLCAACREQL